MARYSTTRFQGGKKKMKKDYSQMLNRPLAYKITPLMVMGVLFVAGMVMNRQEKNADNPSLPEPRQMLTRGEFEDLTPYPSWSSPLYVDSGLSPDDAFLMSPARSMAARDSPLPVHSHMSRYDVTYDSQQQDMIHRNMREQFARWR